MYGLYEKHRTDDGYRYQFGERISLFGCNNGYIPWLLSETLSERMSEPLSWRVGICDALRSVGQPDTALIINLKPNSKAENLSLYEVVEVFGYSSSGWTPVMLYLTGLFVDEHPSLFDEKDFVRSSDETDGPIFSMTYLHGTVQEGQLKGRWTTPGPSPTNSVLLWPAAFQYFAGKAHEIIQRAA